MGTSYGNKHAQAEEQNEFGCPMRFQTGAAAVKNYASIIAGLSPELRAAFETERQAQQAELNRYTETYGYHT